MGRKKKRSWKVLSDYIDDRLYAEDDQDIEPDPEQPTVSAHPGEIPASFYDEEYFTAGTKSNYRPYSPDIWARKLARMIHQFTGATSVLEVGCAYGHVIDVLRERGVDACGFDVSEYAIENSVEPAYTWVGSADDKASFRKSEVDLIVCTEVLEHLSERQIRAFLRNSQIAKQMVILVGLKNGSEMNEDDGHVTFEPKEWWESVFMQEGWQLQNAEGLNNAAISNAMKWSGRFFFLSREGGN